ncbi:hypothetical protein [Alteromonas sp. P256]|uniref:hypothetical protein n=1 Tax=Alteromonas sp. P256 TaxID=3117399 RepID=UPI002FE04018
MPKKQYDIDIHDFIRSLSLEKFTVTDVTRLLSEVHVKMFDKKKNATQFVYRHLKLLEREGVIKKLSTNSQNAIVFCWPGHGEDTNRLQKVSHIENKSHMHIIKNLQEKIRLYKTEMLTNIGETEAYSEWVTEMPELADDVKLHYQHTREQAKVMLGKVKGFERLLAQYEAYL